MYKKIFTVVLSFALFMVVISLGIKGVDFGTHWDEKNTTGLVSKYIRTGSILPGWYAYPSLTTYLAATAVAPYLVPFIENNGLVNNAWRIFLLEDVLKDNPSFLLNVRKVFIITTSLSVGWVYWTLMVMRKRWFDALLAASLLGFSWEISYHSRWVAPDAILMQFGALTIMFLMFGVFRERRRNIFFVLAGISAGFATATKYPGGLLILPVFLAAVFYRDQIRPILKHFGFLAILLAVFLLSYLVMTPGTLFESELFLEQVRGEIAHYSGGHGYHTIEPGLTHFWQNLLY